MSLQWYVHFYGEHAQIFCLQGEICTGASCSQSQRVGCAASVQKLSNSVLWECPLARNVWALSGGKIQKCTNVAPEFYFLFRWMIDKLTQQELEQWAIWNARNKFCFGKTQWHPEQILREATGFLAEYQRLNAAQVQNGGLFPWLVLSALLSALFSQATGLQFPLCGLGLTWFSWDSLFSDVFLLYVALLLCPGCQWPIFVIHQPFLHQ